MLDTKLHGLLWRRFGSKICRRDDLPENFHQCRIASYQVNQLVSFKAVFFASSGAADFSTQEASVPKMELN